MTHYQRPVRASPSFVVQVVLWVVVVPTLAALLISDWIDCERAWEDLEVPCMPAVPETLNPLPMNSALAVAVTDAFQPLSSDLLSSVALVAAEVVPSLFVIPTVYVYSCDSLEVIPFQKPVACPCLFFTILIDPMPRLSPVVLSHVFCTG